MYAKIVGKEFFHRSYMEDILIFGTIAEVIKYFKQSPRETFDMKDLGQANMI